MLKIDADTLWAVAPRFGGAAGRKQSEIIRTVGPILSPTLKRHEIDTPLRLSHLLTQLCHESAGFRTTEEFASGEAYEGRRDLGNEQPGDGRRYKGRGLLQLTGRANYRDYGAALGVDLEGDPTRAAEPALSLAIACQYWSRHDLNRYADRDDLEAVTRRINGGLNGLAERRACLTRAKRVLGERREGDPLRPTLRRGARGRDVGRLQALLRARGLIDRVDEFFGPATEDAVRRVQSDSRLSPDGIAGPATWAALAG